MTDQAQQEEPSLGPMTKRAKLDDGAAEGTEEQVATRMTEVRAGITAYIDPDIPGFQGIIKQRFTDFMVNEIDSSGTVCRITSLDPPPGKLLAQLRPQKPSPSEATQDKQEDAEKAAKEQARSAIVEGGEWPAEADEKLQAFFSSEAIQALKEMWMKGREGKSMATGANATIVSAASILTEPLEDKAHRTQVHKLIRELFHGLLATDSCQVRPRGAKGAEEDEDALANGGGSSTASTRISVRWANRSDRRAGDGLSEEATKSPPYIHFLLHKVNRDHQEAMGLLAESLRLGAGGGGGRGRGRGRERRGFNGRGGGRPPTKDLGAAGTKDKRAVTVQRISLRRNRKTLEDVYRLVNGINADVSSSTGTGKGKGRTRTVLDATTTRADRGIRIGHLHYADQPLKLGQLQGNEFTITLRNVRPATGEPSAAFLASLHSSMSVLRDRGFINYFGMQRFGTGAVPTHHIGILILQNNFKAAIDLLFEPRGPSSPTSDDGDSFDLLKAKQLYKDGELDKAYHTIPRYCVAERHILDMMRSAKWTKGNWMGAFGNVPRSLRSMYVHAYQSYVWNKLVSERIARFGAAEPVEGDVVFADDGGQDVWADEAGTDTEQGTEVEKDDEEDDDNDDDDLRNEAKSGPVPTWQRPIKVLTQEDLTHDEGAGRRRWTIYDVIVPLPGYSIDLPTGWMSELYFSILALDGLTHIQMSSAKVPEYQLKGSYRRMLLKPRNFDYRITSYTDPDIPLTYTDEELCLNPALSNSTSSAEINNQSEAASAPNFTALTLKFQLPSSAYATMLMREALKSDTSSFKHRQMTQNSEDQHFKGTVAA